MHRTFATVMMFSAGVAVVVAGGTAPRAEDIPKYIEQLIKGKAAKDRAVAAEKIGLRGAIKYDDVADAIEPLKNTLTKDKETEVRRAAALALGKIHPEAKDTVPFLHDVFKSEKANVVKVATAEALACFGTDAKAALPDIRAFAKEFDAKKSKEGVILTQVVQTIIGKKKKN